MIAIVTNPLTLHQKSKPYDGPFGDDLKALTDRMFEAMYGTGQGVGLAAIQIGVPLRICVVDIYALQPERRQPRIFVNPAIADRSKRELPMREGCLSAPGKFGDVMRSISVGMTWQDEKGEPHSDVLGGMLAHVLQHEIDHMDGVLCTSKMV